MLLKVGRHIRPAPNFKLIVGREDGENNYLQGYKHQFTTLRSTSHKGPLCLIDGTPSDADVELGARVVARYGQGRNADQVIVAEAGPHLPGELPPISYLSGGLESAHIRKAVCDILEGGERAFQERARRLRVHLER